MECSLSERNKSFGGYTRLGKVCDAEKMVQKRAALQACRLTFSGVCMLLASHCSGKPSDKSLTVNPSELNLREGEEAFVTIDIKNRVLTDSFVLVGDSCSPDTAQITVVAGGAKVKALKEGRCSTLVVLKEDSLTLAADRTDTVKKTLFVNVASNAPDASLPDAGPDVDAGPTTDAGNAICVVPFGKVNTAGGRDFYSVYTDIDTAATPAACPLYQSTDYRGDIVIDYWGGSPGYSIDGRGGYKILTASPATIRDDSIVDALEGDVVTFSFTRRIYADEDAGPGPVWTFVIRVNPDPDPAKWTVSLLSVTKS